MDSITTPAVYEHEIAKHSDFQAGFESIIRNTAVLDRMLVSANTDYVVGGKVTPAAVGLGVQVAPMWGNGRNLDLPVYNYEKTDVIPLALPVSDIRIDTLQVRTFLEEYDEQRRTFYNPETEAGQYFNTPTKKRLKMECVILQGIEGQDIAPPAEEGWIKLAEILVSPEIETLQIEDIRNISAIYQGEENTGWTNERDKTFSLGSQLELKTILALEHTIGGKHREKVIHASNIDTGIGANQVNAKTTPLGDNIKFDETGTDEFLALDSIFTSILKEAQYRRSDVAALMDAIKLISETISDMVHEAPDDGASYARKNKAWFAITGGGGGGDLGDAIEALKFYSKKTIMLTNTRIVDRRQRGYDIGLPYISPTSKAHHFDTDLNDQNQQSNLKIEHIGDEPALVDGDFTNEQIYFNPAVLATPPFEMKGRSLYGYFTLKSKPSKVTETYTAEMWIRLLGMRAAVVLCLDSGMESIALRVGTRGAPEAEYSGAAEDDIEYSAAESPIEYSEAEEDGIEYCAADEDGAAYSIAETPIAYSAAGEDAGNVAIHKWLGGEERVSLDDKGITIPKNTWIHIAALSEAGVLSLYIGKEKVEFERKSIAAQGFSLILNPSKNEFNVDELMIDESAAVPFDTFSENMEERVPYAALDYRKKWFVLEAQDTALVKTNLFETEQFRAAVEAVINNN